MSETIPEQRDRIYELDQNTIVGMARIAARADSADEERTRVRASIPEGMSEEEVNALGLRISNLIESVAPSRDGYSRGRKAEVRAVHWLGSVAFVRRDETTLNSTRSHLRTLGLDGKLAALRLWWEQRSST